MTDSADDSLGARWEQALEGWGLEIWFAMFAFGVVLIFVLDEAWWAVVSKVLIALLWIPMGVRVVVASSELSERRLPAPDLRHASIQPR